MTALAKHFDVLSFVEKSQELGVDEKIAKYQARQIEQAIDIAVSLAKEDLENKEIATKADIDIAKYNFESLKSDLVVIKADLAEVKTDLNGFKNEVKTEFNTVKVDINELRDDFTAFKNEVKIEIALINSNLRETELKLQKEIKEIETKLIKWVVGTGITTIITLAGLLKYFH